MSTPATVPTARRPSAKTTVTSSPRRLCAVVRTDPSAITTPDPRPQPRPSPTTDGPTEEAASRTVCVTSSRTAIPHLLSYLLLASKYHTDGRGVAFTA